MNLYETICLTLQQKKQWSIDILRALINNSGDSKLVKIVSDLQKAIGSDQQKLL